MATKVAMNTTRTQELKRQPASDTGKFTLGGSAAKRIITSSSSSATEEMSGNETVAGSSAGNDYDAGAQASGSRTTARNTLRTAAGRMAAQQRVQWSDSSDTDRQPSPCSSTSWSPPRASRSPTVSMSSCRSVSPLPSSSPPPSSHRPLLLASPSVEFECAECSKAFQTKAEVKMHIEQSLGCSKNAVRPLQHMCDECGIEFQNRAEVEQHRDDVHCGRPEKKKKKQQQQQQQQWRQRSPEKPAGQPTTIRQLTCHICERRFDRAEQLAVHLRRKHGRPDMDCETCGQRFSRRTDLNRHRRAVHLRQRPHQCYDCGQRFAQKSNMLEHRRAVHAANPKAAFQCPRCDKWFSRKHNMAVHVRAVHDGQKQYKCPSCPRSYDQQPALDRHFAVLHAPASAGMPLFLCPVCGKRFSQKSNLTVHKRLHDPIQLLFACPVCHRTYTRKAALNKHACRPVET